MRRRPAESPRSSTPSTRSTPSTPRSSASTPTRCWSPSRTPASRRWRSPTCSSAPGPIDVIVIDSVAALVPRAEIEGEMGDSHVGLQARLMSQALRKIAGALNQTKTTAIFINQLREKIGVMFGSPETTTGGKALKFYASVRLDIRRIETLKDGTDAVGNRTRVKVVKNKMAPPFKTGGVRHPVRRGHQPGGQPDRPRRGAGDRAQVRRLVHLRGRPARPGQGERQELPAATTRTSPTRSRRRSRRSSASGRAWTRRRPAHGDGRPGRPAAGLKVVPGGGN